MKAHQQFTQLMTATTFSTSMVCCLSQIKVKKTCIQLEMSQKQTKSYTNCEKLGQWPIKLQDLLHNVNDSTLSKLDHTIKCAGKLVLNVSTDSVNLHYFALKCKLNKD